jgi:hypothetical protein
MERRDDCDPLERGSVATSNVAATAGLRRGTNHAQFDKLAPGPRAEARAADDVMVKKFILPISVERFVAWHVQAFKLTDSCQFKKLPPVRQLKIQPFLFLRITPFGSLLEFFLPARLSREKSIHLFETQLLSD